MIRLPVRPLLPLLALTALAVCSLTPARAGTGGPESVDFDSTLLRDDLRGVVNSEQDGLCVAFFATAGTRFSATLSPNDTEGAAASGLSLELLSPHGGGISVNGTRNDRSRPNRDIVKWGGVRLEQSGVHTLVAQASTPGSVRLQLRGAVARVQRRVTAAEPLAANDEVEVLIHGAAGGRLAVVLASIGRGFKGELVRVERPDGSSLTLDDDLRLNRIPLDADGEYKVVFRNAGSVEGRYRAILTTFPPRSRLRRAAVRDTGVVFVPSARRIDPRRGVHRDDKLEVTLNGLDFQMGADVRLVRRGFTDILATDIDVVSSTEIRATLDLDIAAEQGRNSIGNWKVGVWNSPQYTDEDDRTTLMKQSFTSHQKLKFTCVNATTISLPRGTRPGTEVWYVEFNDDFQDDLNAMGFGSTDPVARAAMRDGVEAYVLSYLRDLFLQRAQNGQLLDQGVKVSFVVKEPSSIAGTAGEDFNVIEIGGEQLPEDMQDPDGGLAWGFAPLDVGNVQRDELRSVDDDGNRLGLGARTAVLDPSGSSVTQSWIDAMAPLRGQPLSGFDRRYFSSSFYPANPFQASRYAQIIGQLERGAREIAAIAAHHVGKAMGLPGAGNGPMQNPDRAGELWTSRATLAFDTADRNTLISSAVPHAMPGKGGRLLVGFLPLVDQRPFLLPEATTDTEYTLNWDFVGGRPTAIPSDYSMGYSRGSELPIGMTLTFSGLSGKAPLFVGENLLYCRAAIFQVLARDNETKGIRGFIHRLNLTADPNNSRLAGIPSLQLQATNCSNAVRNQ